MNLTAPFNRPRSLSVIFTITFLLLVTAGVSAQDRARVVSEDAEQATPTRPTTRVSAEQNTRRQPTLTNEIVVRQRETPQELVRRTSQSTPTAKRTVPERTTAKGFYNATTRSLMMRSIKNKLGIPYRLGTQGPNLYDCSGFVWKVFNESGLPFTRTSAREFWRTFEPVSGDERYQFGTLVFFNRLGHVGIVVDEEGFYHASSSRGVTYSKFAGYWEKRIVGFRRVPLSYMFDAAETVDTVD